MSPELPLPGPLRDEIFLVMGSAKIDRPFVRYGYREREGAGSGGRASESGWQGIPVFVTRNPGTAQ